MPEYNVAIDVDSRHLVLDGIVDTLNTTLWTAGTWGFLRVNESPYLCRIWTTVDSAGFLRTANYRRIHIDEIKGTVGTWNTPS